MLTRGRLRRPLMRYVKKWDGVLHVTVIVIFANSVQYCLHISLTTAEIIHKIGKISFLKLLSLMFKRNSDNIEQSSYEIVI